MCERLNSHSNHGKTRQKFIALCLNGRRRRKGRDNHCRRHSTQVSTLCHTPPRELKKSASPGLEPHLSHCLPADSVQFPCVSHFKKYSRNGDGLLDSILYAVWRVVHVHSKMCIAKACLLLLEIIRESPFSRPCTQSSFAKKFSAHRMCKHRCCKAVLITIPDCDSAFQTLNYSATYG